MSTLAIEVNPLAEGVGFTADELIVSLVDGRKVSVPLTWYPRLAVADDKQRARWELLGDGQGIHWPDIDEDLSVSGILRGGVTTDASAAVGAAGKASYRAWRLKDPFHRGR